MPNRFTPRLRDGDMCQVSAMDRRRIIRKATAAGIVSGPGRYRSCMYLFWRPRRSMRITGLSRPISVRANGNRVLLASEWELGLDRIIAKQTRRS